MAIKIRLSRASSKKRPFYRVVAADARMPRDGRFIEKLGVYNPLLAKDDEDRIRLDVEKIMEWIGKGAQPTDRVARFLEAAGAVPKKDRANLKKAEPGKKAKDRAAERAKREEAIAAAAAAAAAAPAEEAPAEDAPAATAE